MVEHVANGRSLANSTGLRRIFAACFVGQRSDVAAAAEDIHMSMCRKSIFALALMLFGFVGTADAEMASVYGGRGGYCGSRTANGERVNCSAMTAAHRRLPFGTRVRVCHKRCVTVRINDRGPFVRGRDIDLSPAAARAIGLSSVGQVTISKL
jgi:rare lipoprotein A